MARTHFVGWHMQMLTCMTTAARLLSHRRRLQSNLVPQLSPCDVAALQKCLESNKGDRAKCLQEITAFQQACSKASNPEPHPAQST